MEGRFKKMALSDKKKVKLQEYGFVVSAIVIQLSVFVVFYIFCNFQSILMAFQLRDTSSGEVYWTFQNFSNIWDRLHATTGVNLWDATKHTFGFFILGQILFPISFMTSYFLYKKVPGYKIYRILFFIPSVLSAVVWTTIFKEVVSVKGPVAQIVQFIGGLDYVPDLLGDSRYALGTVMAYSVWFGVAGNFVLYSGTLTRIPYDLIEVGQIDGIKWYQELIKVIVPLVWPTVSTVWLMSLMGIFTADGQILLLTGGGPDNSTQTLGYYLFTQVYGKPETSQTYNYSSAIGLALTVLTLPVVFVVKHLLEKVENVEY